MTRVNVAEAKKRFSDLLGRVAYGGETFVITRRGKPMARIMPLVNEVSEVAQPTVAEVERGLRLIQGLD